MTTTAASSSSSSSSWISSILSRLASSDSTTNSNSSSWMRNLNRFFDPSRPNDIWRQDLARLQTRVQQLQIKCTIGGQTSQSSNSTSSKMNRIRPTLYCEMRLILKEVAYLEAGLQKQIAGIGQKSKRGNSNSTWNNIFQSTNQNVTQTVRGSLIQETDPNLNNNNNPQSQRGSSGSSVFAQEFLELDEVNDRDYDPSDIRLANQNQMNQNGDNSSGSNSNSNGGQNINNNNIRISDMGLEKLGRKELLLRTEELEILNNQIKNIEKLIVDGNNGSSNTTASANALNLMPTDPSQGLPDMTSQQPSTDPNTFSTQQALNYTDQLVQEQEDGLDAFSQTINSLKDIGGNINIEINYHMGLLRELEIQNDSTQNSMERAHTRLREMTRNRTSRWLLFYIGILVILIIVVILGM